MKKFTLIIVTAVLIAGLAGCADKTNPEGSSDISDSSPSTSQAESAVESTVESTTESTESISPENKFTEEQLKLLEASEATRFLTPDGETLLATDAVGIYDDGHSNALLKYDFAYIRYARPFFYAGEMLDDSEKQAKLDTLPEAEWFKVKVGDKLDCGLTVKKAEYERYAVPGNTVQFGGPILNNTIEFDGEITLEGVLYTAQSTRDYLTQPGDLIFAPDPTKTSGIPAITNTFDDPFYNIYFGISLSDNDKIKCVMSDIGCYGWLIGKADEIDKDEIFGDEELVPVKVTLTNVKAGGYTNPDMPTIYTEIVDIERIERT